MQFSLQSCELIRWKTDWPFIDREIQNHNFGQQKRIDSA